MAQLVTIGVYGFSRQTFIECLEKAGVDLLIDVRQRRGVRGAEYAWANSLRLQAALAEAGIAYEHHRYLAPTTELRHLQYAEDARQGVGKRSRTRLATEYIRRYNADILGQSDLGPLASRLTRVEAAALLCVERDAQACHRSLIAERLSGMYGLSVQHLCPFKDP